ncbi:helix-turn-helix domain-containing protein [Corynebacterium renale]|uniref:helix-turn-helix domain-containing protein n=1 Tax=Corynebacterium renale TaxID=1724 RepID=UPI000DF88D38|nr:helix-turn-helix domain-containing protein [Corynebacterium renale]STD70278.1 Uncharacterised protein [Corynebacterium renale]
MSLKAMVWVMEEAPTKDQGELAVLYALADRVDDTGKGGYPSQDWLALRARCSTRTVRRKLQALEAQGLIARGDQRMVAHFSADRRPVVWDICMDGRKIYRPDNLTGRTPVSKRPDKNGQTAGHPCPTNRP